MNTTLNRLPVPTWNRLGVNFAPAAAALPAVPDGGWGAAQVAESPLPAGVCAAAPDFADFSASGVGADADAWVRQNANFVRHIAVNEAVSAPLLYETTLDAAHPAAVEYLTVDAAAHTRLTVVQVLRGDAENGAAAQLTRIRAGQGAVVTLVQVQLLGSRVRRWNAVAAETAQGGKVEQVRLELGGARTVCGTRAFLHSRHAAYELTAAYYGSGRQLLDFNDVSVHTAKDTVCEMHTAGVLTDEADKILRGTVDFQRGAVNGIGHESEDVLLFDPRVRNRTAPLILCGEERVEGQHAASVGRLDEAKLYYLRSRGLSAAQARRLMVDARFAPAIEKLPGEALRQEVRHFVAERLDAYEPLDR